MVSAAGAVLPETEGWAKADKENKTTGSISQFS
jgi:hypothetical protein